MRPRSTLDRYWLTQNVASSWRTCRGLNTVRDFFFRSVTSSVGRRVAPPTADDEASPSLCEHSDTFIIIIIIIII